jgi:hypothetical protein
MSKEESILAKRSMGPAKELAGPIDVVVIESSCAEADWLK